MGECWAILKSALNGPWLEKRCINLVHLPFTPPPPPPPPPDWKSGMSVPTDIAIAYLIQGSFYGHSIYATVYMDAWRKDSAVMVVHHVITLALISFSYAFRWVTPWGGVGSPRPPAT